MLILLYILFLFFPKIESTSGERARLLADDEEDDELLASNRHGNNSVNISDIAIMDNSIKNNEILSQSVPIDVKYSPNIASKSVAANIRTSLRESQTLSSKNLNISSENRPPSSRKFEIPYARQQNSSEKHNTIVSNPRSTAPNRVLDILVLIYLIGRMIAHYVQLIQIPLRMKT